MNRTSGRAGCRALRRTQRPVSASASGMESERSSQLQVGRPVSLRGFGETARHECPCGTARIIMDNHTAGPGNCEWYLRLQPAVRTIHREQIGLSHVPFRDHQCAAAIHRQALSFQRGRNRHGRTHTGWDEPRFTGTGIGAPQNEQQQKATAVYLERHAHRQHCLPPFNGLARRRYTSEGDRTLVLLTRAATSNAVVSTPANSVVPLGHAHVLRTIREAGVVSS